jgi:hypothetical protein
VPLGVVVRGAQRAEHLGGQRGQAVLGGGVAGVAEQPVQPAAQGRVGGVRVVQVRAGLHEPTHTRQVTCR